mgnify:FL=1
MKVFGVIFKDGHKTYDFLGEDDLKKDDYVIVETEKGLQYAKINADYTKEKEVNDNLKSIIRKATEEDEKQYLENLKDAEVALKKCRKFVEELDLNMKVLNAQFTFERTQLLFNFIADERVDFRELARKLAGVYHTRIELRQIGARDKAREIGGIGICGGELCCRRFLNQMETISISMAKDQNLALNPSKINGACGRLLCCLAYENQNYLDNLKDLPQVGDVIKTKSGEGEVVSIDILNRKCQVMIDNNLEDYYIDEDSKK